jgi:hypothetical protein
MSARVALMAVLVVGVAFTSVAGEAPAAATAGNALDALTQRLAATKLSIEVEKQNPDKVFDIIRNAANVNIVIDPAVRIRWEQETVTLRLKDVSALSAFRTLLNQLDLCATYADEAFAITTPKSIQPDPQVSVYDIRDLTTAKRSFRLPPEVLGAQIDPLPYWFRNRVQLGDSADYDKFKEFMDQLDLVNYEAPDPIGDIIAQTVQRATGGKEGGISVTYRDGYLIVVEQPKPTRLPLTPTEIGKATTGTTGK